MADAQRWAILLPMFNRWFGRSRDAQLRVLMVCMGNICRSPMAEAVLRRKLADAGLGRQVQVGSAGTLGAHRGSPPDPRGVQRAGLRGYAMAGQKSRPLRADDFSRFHLLLGMDQDNLAVLQERCPPDLSPGLGLLLDYAPALPVREVPDPYYASAEAFDHALDLIEPACEGLLVDIQRRIDGTS